MIHARRFLRPARFLILLGVVLVVAFFVRNYERIEIPAADQSMDPTYPGGSTVLVEKIDADAPLARGTDVVYTWEADGKTYARFGRVRALPGDVVGAREGLLTVNGEPVGPLPIPGEPMGEVPEGHVLILAVNPAETRYKDSRELDFIPRERIVGILKARVG